MMAHSGTEAGSEGTSRMMSWLMPGFQTATHKTSRSRMLLTADV
jgi:hypothetical protein